MRRRKPEWATPRMTLAVTGEGDGFKHTQFFHLKRDKILAAAALWEPAFEQGRADCPYWPPDPVSYACLILREMLDDGVGKASWTAIYLAAIYLFASSPDPENVEGPATLTILPDGFEVTQKDADLEKTMNHWQEKLNAVPAEAW